MNALPFGLLLVGLLALTILPSAVFAACLPAVAILLALGCLTLGSRPADDARGAPPTARSPVNAAYLASLLLLLLSILPLPLPLTILTGPQRYRQNEEVAVALRQASDLGLVRSPSAFYSATRNRAGTIRATLLWVAAFCAATLAARLPRTSRRAYIRSAAGVAAVIAVLGHVAQWRIPQGDTLWWAFPIPHGLPGPVACFGNRNHFGGFLALFCPGLLSLFVGDLTRRRWTSAALDLVLFCVLTYVVFHSLSRGAMVAYVMALLASGVLFLLQRRVAIGVGLLLGCALVVALALTVAPETVRERIRTMEEPATSTTSYETRVRAWRDTFRILGVYPVLGSGLDAFKIVYPQHRTTTSSAFMTHAENEYVQFAAEAGAVGLLALSLLAAAAWRQTLGPLIRLGQPDPAVAGAAAGALVVAAVHSFFDFVLHTPLYSMALASLAGLLAPPPRPPAPTHPSRLRVGRLPAAAAASLLAALSLGLVGGGAQRADSHVRMESASAEALKRALTWAPTSFHAWYYLGQRACQAGPAAAARFGERCIRQAAACDPNNYRLWLELGRVRLGLGDRTGASQAFARVKQLREWVPVPTVPDR